jgi:hypothetical protein
VTSEVKGANRLVAGLAIIGTEPFDPNRDVGIIVQAVDGAFGRLLGDILRSQRKLAPLQYPGTLPEQTVLIEGHPVSLIASSDSSGRVRSYYTEVRGIHLITNSPQLVRGFLKAGPSGRSLASTPGFQAAEQMMRQTPSPHAIFLVPLGPGANFPPVVAALSLSDSAPNRQRSLSVEVAVPSPWIESLLAAQDPESGPRLVEVYRQLAQHAPATRLTPVPGDAGSLELAITDTCRVFAGTSGRNSYYVGIAEATLFFDTLSKLQPPPRDSAKWVLPFKDNLCGRQGLDAEGYAPLQSFFGDHWRRVFNGDWVAVASERAVLERVTPLLKVEAAARPATLRLRISDLRAATDWLTSAPDQPSALDRISGLELTLAADQQRLLAHGKIDWIGSTEPPPALVERHPQGQMLDALLQLRSLPQLRERADRAILIVVEQRRHQIVQADEADEAVALVRLFELETICQSLGTKEGEALRRRIGEDTQRLSAQRLDQIDELLSERAKLLKILELLKRVPAADQPVRQALVDQLDATLDGIGRWQASQENAQELAELSALLEKEDAELGLVRERIEAQRIRIIETLADQVIQDPELKPRPNEQNRRLLELVRLLPKSVEGEQARKEIENWWRASRTRND